jgi:hypothetical protein
LAIRRPDNRRKSGADFGAGAGLQTRNPVPIMAKNHLLRRTADPRNPTWIFPVESDSMINVSRVEYWPRSRISARLSVGFQMRLFNHPWENGRRWRHRIRLKARTDTGGRLQLGPWLAATLRSHSRSMPRELDSTRRLLTEGQSAFCFVKTRTFFRLRALPAGLRVRGWKGADAGAQRSD